SYPPSGGDLLYAAWLHTNELTGEIDDGGVEVLDISDATQIHSVSLISTGKVPPMDIDARDDRLLSASGTAGLWVFDITHGFFLPDTVATPPGAVALSARDGLAALGVGQVSDTKVVSQGAFQLYDTTGPPTLVSSLPLNVQRVRLRGSLAVVAAGSLG